MVSFARRNATQLAQSYFILSYSHSETKRNKTSSSTSPSPPSTIVYCKKKSQLYTLFQPHRMPQFNHPPTPPLTKHLPRNISPPSKSTPTYIRLIPSYRAHTWPQKLCRKVSRRQEWEASPCQLAGLVRLFGCSPSLESVCQFQLNWLGCVRYAAM